MPPQTSPARMVVALMEKSNTRVERGWYLSRGKRRLKLSQLFLLRGRPGSRESGWQELGWDEIRVSGQGGQIFFYLYLFSQRPVESFLRASSIWKRRICWSLFRSLAGSFLFFSFLFFFEKQIIACNKISNSSAVPRPIWKLRVTRISYKIRENGKTLLEQQSQESEIESIKRTFQSPLLVYT